MQDELASQLDDLREQMDSVLETGSVRAPPSPAAPEERKAGVNPIKHVITGQRLAYCDGEVWPLYSRVLFNKT